MLVGPNASGKSDLGVKIAKKINGEIISADSRQVYRGLNIGSGKITKKEMQGIPHYCLDIANPKKVFSALDFKNCAEKAIADILSRGKTPIIVGGTGFYIDVALGRMKLGGVPPNPKLRKKLSRLSVEKLLATLKKLNPERAKTVEQKNPVRLIRAIEIAIGTREADAVSKLILASPARGSEASAFLPLGKTRGPSQKRFRNRLETHQLLSEKRRAVDFAGFERGAGRFERSERAQRETLSSAAGQNEENKINSATLTWIGIKRPPEELKKRIYKRLIVRLPGIIREVKKLHANGVSWKRLFDFGLEYRYASLYLQKKLTKEEFVTQLEFAIWHYAKRQMTWFKKNKEIRWISLQ